MKISWPVGIVLSLVSFIIFIMYFVFKVTFLPEYNHELVSESYYEDELKYQSKIDKQERALTLSGKIGLKKNGETIYIKIPKEFKEDTLQGIVTFLRMSNKRLDFKVPFSTFDSIIEIKHQNLITGLWNISIEWSDSKNSYLHKEQLYY